MVDRRWDKLVGRWQEASQENGKLRLAVVGS